MLDFVYECVPNVFPLENIIGRLCAMHKETRTASPLFLEVDLGMNYRPPLTRYQESFLSLDENLVRDIFIVLKRTCIVH